MKESKFKVGDKVKTLKEYDVYGDSRFYVGSIGTVRKLDLDAPHKRIKVESEFSDIWYWYSEDELELIQSAEVGPVPVHNKICSDVARDVTVEEVEKLEEELRRKDSELRDLKELIIKLLFDRYGY